jgi:glycosyltransferase involved in cell wall biosynthesis
MSNRGIMYVVTGRAVYWPACMLSIRSLRRAGCVEPVLVATDLPDDLWTDHLRLGYSIVRVGDLAGPPPPRGRGWSLKMSLHRMSPFDHTLYLDTDTIIRSPLDHLWELADCSPLAIAHDRSPQVDAVRRQGPGYGKPAEWQETIALCGNVAPFYNTGVFAWTRGVVAERLFEAWYEEWTKYRSYDQPALIRALHKVRLGPTVLPQEFNAQVPGTRTWKDAIIRHFNGYRKADLLEAMLRCPAAMSSGAASDGESEPDVSGRSDASNLAAVVVSRAAVEGGQRVVRRKCRVPGTHVLYVHNNFPAQFGHIAMQLARRPEWECSFVSTTPAGERGGVEKLQYRIRSGATARTHFCARSFENAISHCDAVYRTLRSRPDIRPDVIVGHSGFGSTLFLRDLYPDVPVVNLFEWYYAGNDDGGHLPVRHDLGRSQGPEVMQRARARNAMMLLDLQNCNAAYAPTLYQRSQFPGEYRPKLDVIFDGIDREVYHGHAERLRPPTRERGTRDITGVSVPPSKRVVTYVTRRYESMRGFDIFMRSAKLIAAAYPDVLFIVVGREGEGYSGDGPYLEGKQSFKEWVLSRDEYDLSKFVFADWVDGSRLSRLLAATDLHIYLTAPFVLSWSMMDAMSCGAVVLGSDTPPVREMIRDGHNGLLAEFLSPEDIADKAVSVLKDPAAFRPLGRAAEQMIEERYSLEVVLPQHIRLYERAMQKRGRTDPLECQSPNESAGDPAPADAAAH